MVNEHPLTLVRSGPEGTATLESDRLLAMAQASRIEATMRKGMLIVQSRPVHPERVDEWNDWYDNVHIPEMCGVPGFVSAHRYRAVDRASGELDTENPSFLAVYEMEADDLSQPLKEVRVRTAEGRMSGPGETQIDPAPVITLYELYG